MPLDPADYSSPNVFLVGSPSNLVAFCMGSPLLKPIRGFPLGFPTCSKSFFSIFPWFPPNFHQKSHPFLGVSEIGDTPIAGCFISWNIPIYTWMTTRGTPIFQEKPPNRGFPSHGGAPSHHPFIDGYPYFHRKYPNSWMVYNVYLGENPWKSQSKMDEKNRGTSMAMAQINCPSPSVSSAFFSTLASSTISDRLTVSEGAGPSPRRRLTSPIRLWSSSCRSPSFNMKNAGLMVVLHILGPCWSPFFVGCWTKTPKDGIQKKQSQNFWSCFEFRVHAKQSVSFSIHVSRCLQGFSPVTHPCLGLITAPDLPSCNKHQECLLLGKFWETNCAKWLVTFIKHGNVTQHWWFPSPFSNGILLSSCSPTWRFPEIEVPLVIIHFRLGFSTINHPAMGVSPFMETPT